MARRVFFSFHYKNDIVRVSRIRNSGVFSAEGQPFLDKAQWETIKRSGVSAVKNWIDKQMNGTSVVIICIGMETYERKWVRHEIEKAYSENRGLLGIYLNGMKDFNGQTIGKGKNPLSTFFIEENGKKVYLSDMFPTYSWNDDDGYTHFQSWIEEAARKVGR
ncbi:TIR domain-containing protein [Owenweeksia hongkongensis]|uniref:TIR domain-containing protein n=1 Tax=Owenweeksia hongkongensis TaxID=253245 RepID=UPI003A91FC2B